MEENEGKGFVDRELATRHPDYASFLKQRQFSNTVTETNIILHWPVHGFPFFFCLHGHGLGSLSNDAGAPMFGLVEGYRRAYPVAVNTLVKCNCGRSPRRRDFMSVLSISTPPAEPHIYLGTFGM